MAHDANNLHSSRESNKKHDSNNIINMQVSNDKINSHRQPSYSNPDLMKFDSEVEINKPQYILNKNNNQFVDFNGFNNNPIIQNNPKSPSISRDGMQSNVIKNQINNPYSQEYMKDTEMVKKIKKFLITIFRQSNAAKFVRT